MLRNITTKSEFVQQLIQFKKDAETNPAYVATEQSKLDLDMLQMLLTAHSGVSSDAPLNPRQLKSFALYLKHRWDRVKKDYCGKSIDALLQPKTPADAVCLHLAEQLAKHLPKNQLSLLVPTLRAFESDGIDHSRLAQYTLSTDGQSLSYDFYVDHHTQAVRNIDKEEGELINRVVVSEIQKTIQFYRSWSQGRSKDIFVNREDELTLKALEDLLKSQLKGGVPSAGSLRPFIEFLEERWNRIYVKPGTDADYFQVSKTVSDAVCKAVAELVSNYTDFSPIALLIPSLEDLESLSVSPDELYHYVLSDNGKRLIDVMQYDVDSTNPNLKHRLAEYSADEIVRINHKLEHLKSLFKSQASSKQVASKWQTYRFVDLEEPSCPSYGEAGDVRLRKSLHPQINSAAEFGEIMAAYPDSDKDAFLNHFSVEELRQILLNGKGFTAAVQDQSMYAGSEAHAKNVLTAFLVLYMKELSLRNTPNSSKTGYWYGQPTKDNKDAAAKFAYGLLLSKASLSEIDDLLTKSDYKAEFNDYHTGIRTSALSALRYQVTKAKDPVYRHDPAFVQEVQPKKGWFY